MHEPNLDELKELYKSWSNEELTINLTKFRNNYLPESIALMQLELSNRTTQTSEEEHPFKNNRAVQDFEEINSEEKTIVESKANSSSKNKSPKIELGVLLNKLSPAVKLLFGVVFFGVITYLVSENPFTFSGATCLYIIYGTISFIFIAIMTFEIYSLLFRQCWTSSDTLKYLFPFLISNITTAFLVQHQYFKYYEINFWVCLICWIYLYVVSKDWDLRDSDELKNSGQYITKPFENIIIVLSAAWTISSVYITLGTTLFDYGKLPINNLQEIHSLLDIRINLAIIILVFIVIKSIVFVLQNKKVELKALFKPLEQVSGDRIEKNLFLHVLTIFLNLALNLLGSLGNIFYKALATVVIYLFYIGGEIYNSFSWLLKKSVNLLFYLIELTAVITAFYFINKTCFPLLQYLRENTWIDSYLPLFIIIIYSVLTIVCVIAINYFRSMSYNVKNNRIEINIEGFNKVLARDIQAFPYLIAVIWVIGVITFFVAKIDFLHFTTFKTFGIMSTILSSVVFIGFIIYLYNNFKSMEHTEDISDKT